MSQEETKQYFRVIERLRIGNLNIGVAPIEIHIGDQNKNWLKISGVTTMNEQPPKSRILLQGTTRCYDRLEVSGNITADDVLINSSQELKQDICTLTKEEAYNLIEDLEPVKFVFKDDSAEIQNIGFIAEDVPDIVSDKDHKQVRYMEIISALTKVVKEQQKKIDKLENKLDLNER
jgi:Chaperone of endosialidase